MDLAFGGELIYWRGPAPWHFVRLPDEQGDDVAEVSARATYGWGCIPVEAQIGRTRFSTSLFPKDGGYLVPVKAHVRRAESLDVGDVVTVQMHIDV